MEQILEHIADEQEIKQFHTWISDLCHPDSPVPNVDQFDKIVRKHEQNRPSMPTMGKDANLTSTCPQEGQRVLRALANKFVSIMQSNAK